jgi:thymidylate synthase ThyX
VISAKIIADSLNPVGCRLTTFILKYPRFIHSEIMTHRAFSRNAASSRAIPIAKMISNIREEPAMPYYWGMNQKGMQANQELDEATILKAESIWLESMESQIRYANQLLELGVHKQITNRLLEPYFHMVTLLSATEFGNFFNLRAHKDAMPEFQELAFQMLDCYENNVPKELAAGDWHLPFGDRYVNDISDVNSLIKISAARAARVSYLNFDGKIEYDKDYTLCDSLITNGHASPLEHPAMAIEDNKYYGNFRGFIQYRKTLANENKTIFNAEELRKGRKHYGRTKNCLAKVD